MGHNMRTLIRFTFVCWLFAGLFFVAQQPLKAANFCDTEQGYHILWIGYANCYPGGPTFCWEMDYECDGDCEYDYYGICFDMVNPCEYYCCCWRPT